MIRGKKVYITAIEETDLEKLKFWRNNPEYRKYFREYKEINSKIQKKWFETIVCCSNNTIMFSIRSNNTDELLGCCGLCNINWLYRYADLSLYIGWKESYIDDEGIAEESCKLLFDYAFKEINLNKVWTEIYEFDYKKKLLYENIGMQIDGIFRQNYFYDGKWWNSYLMTILQEEYNYRKKAL